MTTASRDSRPDPKLLLAQVQEQEQKERRGRLKVFFGAAAGVGKTYAMLSAGRAKASEGVDVVVGYAEPHARPETERLLLGLEILPSRTVEYKETKLREFDLDAALKRNPELILVDELAHTNAPGSRHDKRWQDVEELLGAGIDVYTTLNVQHMESLNDVVAQVTGITVRETLPDDIFDRADEVELVDLSPDDLLERLREGKIYLPQQAVNALQGFFKKANLTALRELSLRKTAERVGQQLQSERLQQFARQTWPTAERVLVCISPSRTSAKVIRSAKRLAVSLNAEWIAAFVETPRLKSMDDASKDLLFKHFRLAERLGAETVTLSGLSIADELITYARSRNVSKIVIGKSDRSWWVDLFLRPQVDQLLRKSGEIDVYVVRGIGADNHDVTKADRQQGTEAGPGFPWASYGWSALTVLICTFVAACMFMAWQKFDLSNLIMIYLVGVVVVSARYGRGPSAFAAVFSVLVFDFFFVPPRFSFAVSDTQYLITFMVMLGVALLIGTLTVRIQEQADAARQRERRTEDLYRMTQQLVTTRGLTGLCEASVRQLADVFHANVVLLSPADDGAVTVRASLDGTNTLHVTELAVAQWVLEHEQVAGAGTDTLPASAATYLPLVASRGCVGVVGLSAKNSGELLSPRQRPLLDAFLNQIALAIERDQLSEEARRSQVQAEAEALRSSLLSSVSHDLRTPLAIISGATVGLLDASAENTATRVELANAIRHESERLNRLVGNLLDITRLESGGLVLNKQWQPVEEIVGVALNHLDVQLAGRQVTIRIPSDLPMVLVDGILIEQVLVNLIENCLKYSHEGLPIEIEAQATSDAVELSMADHGPGLKAGEESQIFDKFYRGTAASSKRGVGLGLAICRAIIQAHGGTITAKNRPAGSGTGAVFKFSLPNVGKPPSMADAPITPMNEG